MKQHHPQIRELNVGFTLGDPRRETDDAGDVGQSTGPQRGPATHGMTDEHDRHRPEPGFDHPDSEGNVVDGVGVIPTAVPVPNEHDCAVRNCTPDRSDERLHSENDQAGFAHPIRASLTTSGEHDHDRANGPVGEIDR